MIKTFQNSSVVCDSLRYVHVHMYLHTYKTVRRDLSNTQLNENDGILETNSKNQIKSWHQVMHRSVHAIFGRGHE